MIKIIEELSEEIEECLQDYERTEELEELLYTLGNAIQTIRLELYRRSNCE